jgi:hypothetical protein
MAQILAHSCQWQIRSSKVQLMALHRSQSSKLEMARMFDSSEFLRSMCSIQQMGMALIQHSTIQLRVRNSKALLMAHSTSHSTKLWLAHMECRFQLILNSSNTRRMGMERVQHNTLQLMARRHRGSRMAHSNSWSIQLQLVRM